MDKPDIHEQLTAVSSRICYNQSAPGIRFLLVSSSCMAMFDARCMMHISPVKSQWNLNGISIQSLKSDLVMDAV